MNQFIIYLTAGTHIESAAKHSAGLSLVVIITCNVWTLQLKVKGVQYSSSEKYLFEITNICARLTHALHYCLFSRVHFPCLSFTCWLKQKQWGCSPAAVALHPGCSWADVSVACSDSQCCPSVISRGIKLKSLTCELASLMTIFLCFPPSEKFWNHI